MSFNIRRMVVDDTDAVMQLIREEAIYHDQLEYVKIDKETFIDKAFGKNALFGVYVAELDGELIGYVSYTINFSIWAGQKYMSIDDVFITEACRGMGAGKALMSSVKDGALAAGLTMIRWEVEVDNQRAISFYEGLGARYRQKGIFTWSV